MREQEWLAGLTYDEIDVDAKLLTIKKVIDALPEGCRKIFVMSVIEGMSYTDTAKELGVSVNTVKSQVKIAYKKLKIRFRNLLIICILLFYFYFP